MNFSDDYLERSVHRHLPYNEQESRKEEKTTKGGFCTASLIMSKNRRQDVEIVKVTMGTASFNNERESMKQFLGL